MENKSFEITASAQGKVANIRIVGHIGWQYNANDFRYLIDDLVADGCTSAHLYINSQGGSVFDAAEIVNILEVFDGNVTGEGGALVASAATYISASCKSFVMPSNGQFMIHKPRGGAHGTTNDISSFLALLEGIEKNYFDTYSELAKDKKSFKEKWDKGDNWMTAQEAQKAGFITGVKEKIKIDRATAAMITACMSGANNNTLIKDEMNTDFLKTTAKTLGLPDTATQEQINAEIASNMKAKADLEALRKEQSDNEAKIKAQTIEAALTAAITDKRIKADAKADWQEMLESNLETGLKALKAITPITPLTDGLEQGHKPQAGKVTYEGKTFEELRDTDPDALASLMASDMDTYRELYGNYLTRNKLK